MKYTLARFTVKPEHLKDTRLALAGLIAEVRQYQPRTLYTVFRTDTPGTFVALMCFENEAAEKRHSQSHYIAEFARKILPWCDGKPLFRELAIFSSTRKQWMLETEPFAADQLLGLPAKAKAPAKRVTRPKQVRLKKMGRRTGQSASA
jgi:quinol monooxygenase YgiN